MEPTKPINLDQTMVRDCPPPPTVQRRSHTLFVPPGAIDSHAHVIGHSDVYPFTTTRSYTPQPASATDYVKMLDAIGMTYGVLVQVSVHGSDNRLLLETLQTHRERMRGVAVMPLGLPEKDYVFAKSCGVVALRLNDLYGGGIGFDTLREYGALAKEMGWHLEFLLDVRRLPNLSVPISDLPVPFVVDHMGHFPVDALDLNSPEFQTLVQLVRDGAWVKLSGAYRLSNRFPCYEDTTPYARALLEAGSSRCVWGSDWPHVSHWKMMMQVADLLDTLALWAPDGALQQAILVDNPSSLYGFASR